jgi:hypothetical protein
MWPAAARNLDITRVRREILRIHLVALALCASSSLPCDALTPADFVRDHGPLIAITHVQVIDGTGNAPRGDQTVVIDHERISSIPLRLQASRSESNSL